MTDLPIAGKLVPLLQAGVVADAADIATTDGNLALQTVLNNLDQTVLHWRFNGTVTDTTNPGFTFLALNNVAKDNATIISFNVRSNNGNSMFTELLTALRPGDRIYLQQRTLTTTSILYRVTGAPTLDGTKVNIPIARERDQGVEFTDQADLNVRFFQEGAGDGAKFRRAIDASTSPLVQVNALDSTALSTSLSGLTLRAGDMFRISNAGEPFDGITINAAIGDTLVATVDSPSSSDINDWGMIPRPNALTALHDSITGSVANISSLESKIDALFPLTPDVSILDSWAAIFDPTQTIEDILEQNGYTSFIDYRSASDKYESTGIVFDNTGTNVVDYTGLGSDLHRCLGFGITGPSAKTLVSVIDGAETIPYIDMTAGATLRVNNYTPSRTQDQVVTDHDNVLSDVPTSGTNTLSVGGPVTTYTIPAYPANTSSQTRSLEADFDVILNSQNTQSGGFIEFEIPDDVSAATRVDRTHNFHLGYPYSRDVTVTVGLEARVSGADLVVDFSLRAAPVGITLEITSVTVVENYTASVVIPRVDNFVVITDESGVFTFSGAQEFLFAFHPIPNTSRQSIVPVALDVSTGVVSQLNDVVVPEPAAGFEDLQIPDDIEFRSFLPDHFLNHVNLAALVSNRTTKWVYGLALLREVTENVVTAPIDLATGTKLNGVVLNNSDNSVVHQSANTGIGAGGLLSSVQLPTNYADSDYVYVEVKIGTSWIPVTVSTALLSQTLFTAGDSIYVNGTRSLTWTVGSRTLAVDNASQIIAQVALKKLD